MRSLSLLATVAALTLAPMTAANAKSVGFESNIEQTLSAPVKLEVVLSESLQHRADNLPKELSKRGSGSNLRSGFTGNGYYGERDLERLVSRVEEEMVDDFSRRGLVISDDAAQTLRVTIVDAKNNRPTFEQLSRDPSLSYQSFGTGGIELTAELIGANDAVIGDMSYYWFETNIRDGFSQSASTWSDARRGISHFSRKAAKSLS